MKQIELPLEVQKAHVIFASHSGGKDSQAMGYIGLEYV
jgi:hypothetical protein